MIDGIFIFLAFIIFFSFLGMVFLLYRKMKEVDYLSREELLLKIKTTKPLSQDIYDYIVNPISVFWHTKFLPKIYKDFEKAVSRFRINILKIETWLFKLANNIRGKRQIKNNHQSDYWKDVGEFKNGERKDDGGANGDKTDI